MQPKKHPRADLERWRSFFFLIGVAAVLTAAIFVLQYKTEVAVQQPLEADHTLYSDHFDMPVTRPEVRKAAKPKKPSDKLPEEASDPVDDPELWVPDDFPDDGDDGFEEPVKDIGVEFPEEAAELVSIVVVEHIAVPAPCAAFSIRGERMDCINKWIREYVQENLQYPARAREMRLSDKLYVNFVISEKGKVQDVVTHGQYEILNQEAERVLRSMPEWIPARQLNKPVKMSMTIPVSFEPQ